MKSKKLILNLAALLSVAFTTQLHADMLDPMDYASLGAFDVTNGAYVIDTDALTISETNGVSTNLLFTGVMDDQKGQADSFGPGTNVTTVGSNGIPYIAVFTFDDLKLDGTATFTVTGHRALALLSQGDALVNVTLSLNGEFASQLTNDIVPGAGGPGGFAGGSPAMDGEGPGGGGGIYYGLPASDAGNPASGGAGGFGGQGQGSSYTLAYTGLLGPAYGNLTQVLQGGSGGGGAVMDSDFTPLSQGGGGGGGGALELGAARVLTIGTNGILRANGGISEFVPGSIYNEAYPGCGSGGGIILHADRLFLNGLVEAKGVQSPNPQVSGAFPGGGGRVWRVGDTNLPGYTIGTPINASAYTAGVNVNSSRWDGWVTATPAVLIVPRGQSFELGTVTIAQANSTSHPGVEMWPHDLQAQGSVTVPAGGITYLYSIELDAPSAAITGADPLVLGENGKLYGQGIVQVDVINGAGANIDVVDNLLTFTGSISNQAGGDLTVVNGTLTVPGDGNGATDDGVVNLGTLNLVDGVINGDVRSPGNSIVNVIGTATFNGLFKGGAGFSGTQNLVTFNGGYSPGDSPAAVSFGGSVAFGSGNTLTMELAGTNAGAQYDQLNVGDTATLGGTLEVVLTNGFVPAAGEVFHLINAAQQTNAFTTVNLPALGAGLAWDNQIAANGSIAVVTAPGGSGPQFGPTVLSGGNLIFSGTGGITNGSFVVLSSTNVAAPLPNWIPVSTNPFDANGNFMLTNPINPSQPREFYRLQQQ